MTTHPFMGPPHVQPDGSTKRYWLPGDEVLFDRTLAQQHGRTCGPDCQGGCFAEMHSIAWNYGHVGPGCRFEALDATPAQESAPTDEQAVPKDQDGVILPMRKRRRKTA